MEEQKPIEEMTPLEMVGELTERREADNQVMMLMQQNGFMRYMLGQMGIQIAFSPAEAEQIVKAAEQADQQEEFPHGI